MDFVKIERPYKDRSGKDLVIRMNKGELKNNEKVCIEGYVHQVKKMKGFSFINIRSPRYVFQCTISGHGEEDITEEDCVILNGKIKLDERSPLGFEIVIDSIKKVGGPVEKLPVEINNDRIIDNLQLNTLLDNRIITLRNPKVRSIMRISDGVQRGFRRFLQNEDFVEFIPPKIVQAGAEGGADMFEVDYFGERAYLNQSPQMYKQAMVGVFNNVFTVGPVFRGEKHSTVRHINEFQGLDLEMGFIDSFYDLIELESRMFIFIYDFLNSEYQVELDNILGVGKRLKKPDSFPMVRFSEAKELYCKANGTDMLNPADLEPEEEKWLGDWANKEFDSPILYITHYPAKKRPFYAMDDPEDDRYTMSYDMLLNGMEVTTGGQRINDYNKQVEKMKKRKMDISLFGDYLTMHKYGLPPHGGMGLGLERVVERLLSLDNIREACAFPRDRERLTP